jgi:hypothetical protein
MIRVEVLPAAFGDCILIEYGKGGTKQRILIDAGLTKTYKESLLPRLEQLEDGEPVQLELLVVTHIDRDHICGILPLLRAEPPMVEAKDIWFNGRRHLARDELGVKDGEALQTLIEERGLPWNVAFGATGQQAVVVPDKVENDDELPRISLDGGAVITLLSPCWRNLEALAEDWPNDTLGSWDEPEAVHAIDSVPPDALGKRPALTSISVDEMRDLAEVALKEDTARPNGSSIAFLFEFEQKRILFGADAFPSVLLESLNRFSPNEVVELHAFKLPHHGSMNNISEDLLAKVKCSRFLISTNGATFGHPHPEAISRIACSSEDSKEICFNHSSDYTIVWDDPTTSAELKYTARYPEDELAGYVFEL